MIYQWDPKKAVANLRKHGVPFDEARSVFTDPLALTFPDPELRLDEKTGHWRFGEIDWSEFKRVLAGDGPCNRQRMQVKTNLPGVQIYGAYHFKQVYPGWHAVCVEPENFPDAPNHDNFPSSILRPGETHRSFMSFTFSA